MSTKAKGFRWGSQVITLLRKNVWLFQASPWITALAVLSPLICLVIAALLSHHVFQANTGDVPEPTQPRTAINARAIQACDDGIHDCRPQVYYAPNDPYHVSIIQTLQEDLGLNAQRDLIGFRSKSELIRHLLVHQIALAEERSWVVGLTFNTFPEYNPSSDLKSLFQATPTTYYDLWNVRSGRTLAFALPGVVGSKVYAKHLLDQAIVRTRSQWLNEPIPSFNVSLTTWPRPEISIKGVPTAREMKKQFDQILTYSLVLIGWIIPMYLIKSMLADESKLVY
jgi:hypothetical protein